MRFHYRNLNIRNQGIGGVNLPDVATNFRDREDQLFYTQKTAFSGTALNQFRILVARQHTPATSVSPGPKIIVLDAFTGGGAQSDRLQTENHLIFDDILSWTRGKHTFKSGFNIPDLSRRALDDNTNSAGTFSFSSLDDYFAGRPFSFVQQRGADVCSNIGSTVGSRSKRRRDGAISRSGEKPIGSMCWQMVHSA